MNAPENNPLSSDTRLVEPVAKKPFPRKLLVPLIWLMKWVIVVDEHGTTPAVRMPCTSIIIYSLTMISNRIECGENVDFFELFNGLTGESEQLMLTAKT
jgi:hypothetical protein